jgi:hypothetical protein
MSTVSSSESLHLFTFLHTASYLKIYKYWDFTEYNVFYPDRLRALSHKRLPSGSNFNLSDAPVWSEAKLTAE